MSLTSLLQKQDVKQRFRQEFPMPTMAVEREIFAPPLSNHYSLVGTAFDYLMRFYLKRLNPDAVAGQWIAEQALSSPLLGSVVSYDLDVHRWVAIKERAGIAPSRETELAKKARSIIAQAKVNYADYLSLGQITDQLMESALQLAQLDPIFRAGVIDENLGNVHKEDVDDLRKLIYLVEPQLFKASCLCLLDPTFGEASQLVGGADADLVIDDAIIDIKTTKNLKLERDYFNQLIGYLVLHEITGVGGLVPKPKITRLGIYFSRYAFLYMLDLGPVIHQDKFPVFVDWFIARAKQAPRLR